MASKKVVAVTPVQPAGFSEVQLAQIAQMMQGLVSQGLVTATPLTMAVEAPAKAPKITKLKEAKPLQVTKHTKGSDNQEYASEIGEKLFLAAKPEAQQLVLKLQQIGAQAGYKRLMHNLRFRGAVLGILPEYEKLW